MNIPAITYGNAPVARSVERPCPGATGCSPLPIGGSGTVDRVAVCWRCDGARVNRAARSRMNRIRVGTNDSRYGVCQPRSVNASRHFRDSASTSGASRQSCVRRKPSPRHSSASSAARPVRIGRQHDYDITRDGGDVGARMRGAVSCALFQLPIRANTPYTAIALRALRVRVSLWPH
jgi:hypothetical protein